jgi:prepilin-type N-terminal cleavage/methylation domain-containing protein
MLYSCQMKNKTGGFTLVEVMIVVAVIALLAAIAIPNLLRAKVASNESSAQATLKTIANALETYTITNGKYPSDTTSLIGAAPPYLNKDYFISAYNGYTFTASLSDYAYAITAVPSSSNHGVTSFTISTGAVLSSN